MMIWIKCPEQNRAVPTGIDVHPACFAMLPESVAGFTCAACGQRHELRREQAWLAEAHPLLPDRRTPRGEAAHYVRGAARPCLHSDGGTVMTVN